MKEDVWSVPPPTRSPLDRREKGFRAEELCALHVRCFGSEDRPSPNPVAGRNDIFDYVIFKATDIKDLIICDAPEPAVQFANGLPHDPAIANLCDSQPHARSPPEDSNIESGQCHGGNRNASILPPLFFSLPGSGGATGEPRRNVEAGHTGVDGSMRVTRGSSKMKKEKRINMQNDYDFEKANRQFSKALNRAEKKKEASKDNNSSVHQENGEGGHKVQDATKEGGQANTFYDRGTSFFDRISYRTIGDQDERTPQRDWNKERMRNEQTFGEAAVRSFAYHNARRYVISGSTGGDGMRFS
ncbi:Protein LSM14 -like protein B-B [Toxocara canis]|uniref:Protein LSM14-like protein B-B n=1 Tax=Toxocara canis TaxID=6265 RepID=A0A0B2UVC9_TOXCA|nr:Protein LSM14 -like protein B-B [Toxocara canis]